VRLVRNQKIARLLSRIRLLGAFADQNFPVEYGMCRASGHRLVQLPAAAGWIRMVYAAVGVCKLAATNQCQAVNRKFSRLAGLHD